MHYNFLLLLFLCLSTVKLIAQTPVADFLANKTAGCAPLLVIFSDNSSGNPNSWAWDFSNGNNSTYQNPSAIFINPGTYSVSLTVSNTSGSNTVTKSAFITVYAEPVAGFTSDTVSGCVPFTVNFSDQSAPGSGTVDTWFWDFGDGGTSIQENPARTYMNPGYYTVYLLCKNSYGCQNKIIKSAYISAYMPVANFDFTPVCHAPFSVNFSNYSTGVNLNYEWNFGDASISNAINPTHTFASTGNYNVWLRITDEIGCKDSIAKTVSINDFIADFTYTVSCTDSDFTIGFTDASSLTAKTWFWDFGDGNLTVQQHPAHTYGSIIPYNITLIAGIDSSCTDTVIKTYVPPDAQFILDNMYLCGEPFTVNFNNLSSGTPLLNYEWDFGDSILSQDSDVVHTYSVPASVYVDTYYVQMVVKNQWGCSDTLNDSIFIQKPKLSFDADPDRGCIPLTVNFKDTTESIDPIVNWEWIFGDGSLISNIKNPTHTYNDTGHYTVTLVITTASGCIDTLKKINLIMSGIPPDFVDFSISKDTICHHSIIDFFDLSGYFDTIVKINYWCWVFHWYDFALTGPVAEDLKDDCETQGFFEIHTSPVTIQNPQHDYDELFIQYDQGIFGGDIKWYDFQHKGKFGFDTIRLFAGYNGCTDTVYKTIFIHPPTAYPGFIFPDSIDLAACSAPATFGFFNGSITWDTLLYYYILHQQSGDTIYNFATQGYNTGFLTFIDDTTPKILPYQNITFTRAGNYGIYISVLNDSTGCIDRRYRELTIDSVHNGFTAVPDVACLPGNAITFTDTSISFFGFVTGWKWIFGDGDSLSGSATDTIFPQDTHGGRTSGSYNNPTHSYLDTGTYIVRSEITVDVPYKLIGGGRISYLKCFYESPDIIKIYHIYPGFIADTTKGCSGLQVFFTDLSVVVSPVNQWRWDFGDLSPVDTNQNLSHTYNGSGSYDVTLIVEDTMGCSDTLTKTAYITITDPVAGFSADPVNICIGDSFFFFTEPVSFNNSSSGDSLAFFWNFGDGSTSILKDPEHTFTDQGFYSVSLIATDTMGCSDTLVQQNLIAVYDPPHAGFIHDIISTGCAPDIVSFTDTSAGSIQSWFWGFGDGQNSSEQNPVHIYTTAGSYDVYLYVTDLNGCESIEIKPGVFNTGGPIGTFMFTPDSGCKPLDVIFTSDAQNVDFYFWDFGDGSPFGTNDSMAHTFAIAGNFTPSLILSDSGGCILIVFPDTIIFVDELNPDFLSDDTITCNPDTIQFTDLTNPPPASWFWDFGDGITSILKNPAHFYDSAGEFSVSLMAASPECTVTVSKPGYLAIYDQPITQLTSSDSSGCTPFSVQFNAIISSGVSYITAYQWDFGDGAIADSLQNNSHLFTSPGNFPVKLKITYGKGNCTIMDSIVIIAGYPPDAGFLTDVLNPDCIMNTSFQFINKSANSESYFWNFGDGSTSAEPVPFHTYIDTGYFMVNLLAFNQTGCIDTAVLSIHVYDYSELLRIPNVFTPNNDGVNDFFYIEGSDQIQISGIIFNRWGIKIHDWDNPENQWDGTLKGKKVPDGVYYYILTICNEEKRAGFVYILR